MGFMQYVTLMSLMPSAFCIREVLLVHLGVDSYRPLHAALNDKGSTHMAGHLPGPKQRPIAANKSQINHEYGFLGPHVKSVRVWAPGTGDRDWGWDGSALRLSLKHGNNALSPHIQ